MIRTQRMSLTSYPNSIWWIATRVRTTSATVVKTSIRCEWERTVWNSTEVTCVLSRGGRDWKQSINGFFYWTDHIKIMYTDWKSWHDWLRHQPHNLAKFGFVNIFWDWGIYTQGFVLFQTFTLFDEGSAKMANWTVCRILPVPYPVSHKRLLQYQYHRTLPVQLTLMQPCWQFIMTSPNDNQQIILLFRVQIISHVYYSTLIV